MKHLSVSNFNYVLMPEKERKQVREQFADVLEQLPSETTVTFTVYPNKMYVDVSSDEAETEESICASLSSRWFNTVENTHVRFSPVSEDEVYSFYHDFVKKNLKTSSGEIHKLSCDEWTKELREDAILPLIKPWTMVKLTVTVMPEKESILYIKEAKIDATANVIIYTKNKKAENLKEAQSNLSEIQAHWDKILHKGHRLVKACVDVYVYGTTQKQMSGKIALVKEIASEKGIFLHEQNKKKVCRFFRKNKDASICPHIWKLIPFTSQSLHEKDGFVYGSHALTNEPVQFDRREAQIQHGLIFAPSSVRHKIMWREIAQIVEKTEDDAIVLSNEGQKIKINLMDTSFLEQEAKQHCTPEEICQGEKVSEIYENCEIVFESFLGRKLTDNEISALHKSVQEMIKKRSEKIDFAELKYFLEQQNNTEKLVALYANEETSPATLDAISSDIPSARLQTISISYGMTDVEKLMISRYIQRRSYDNHHKNNERGTSKHLWIYIEDFDKLEWSKAEKHMFLTRLKRSRGFCTIYTIGTESFSKFIKDDVNIAIVNNVLQFWFSQDYQKDLEAIRQMFEFPSGEMKYINNDEKNPRHIIFYNGREHIPMNLT